MLVSKGLHGTTVRATDYDRCPQRGWTKSMPQLLQDSSRTEEPQFVPMTDVPAESTASASDNRPSFVDVTEQFNKKTLRTSLHWTGRLRDPLGDALARIKARDERPGTIEHAPQATQRDTSDPIAESVFPSILPMHELNAGLSHEELTLADCGNRRKFPRRRSECRVAIVRRSETEGLTPQQIDWLLESGRAIGRLKNLSQLGICLILASTIASETEVLLRITNDDIGRHVDVTALVIGSQAGNSGTFTIHCRTLRDFTLDELQDLGQPVLFS